MRIDIELISLPNQQITHTVNSCLYLDDHSMTCEREYYSKVPVSDDPTDHTLGWKEVFRDSVTKIKKDALVSIDLIFSETDDCYRVEIEANGYPEAFYFYFETKEKAKVFFDIMDEYIFTDPIETQKS